MGRIIGIDLGTTNSCAAVVVDERKVKLIPYRGGEYTIPSIFAVDAKGHELVGHEAKRQWQLNPKQTIYGSKRLMGREYDPQTAHRIQEYFLYGIEKDEQTAEVQVAVAGRQLPLTEVASKILMKIRDVASDYLQEVIDRAVVTVPAYFNDRQRQAVKEAGRLGGLEVVRVINEPTAAALAFGVGRARDQELVAIYDLGGGTFDVSIIEIRDHVFEVKATGGDIFLGGADFDNKIIDWVLESFTLLHSDIDLRKDPIAMQRIKDLAERSKIDLTARKECAFNIPFITMTPSGQPLDIDLILTRKQLESRTHHLIERTIVTCERVCRDAGVHPHEVQHVLLVGGMTRMPLVQKTVTKYFGHSPSKQVNADEAVAVGAAMFAWSLEDTSHGQLQLLDVIPMAIGIEDAQGNLHKIFERNDATPNAKKMVFTTSLDNQLNLEIRIYQGDSSRARDNDLLGAFDFSGIRPGPAGAVRVNICFTLSQDGMLSMSAHDTDTGTQMTTKVQTNAKEA
ncbi:MAG: Hsp70 family protein [Myxococcales bacterium]|nr:Hsp70 family protein [Myxococcales bacterium]